MEIQAAIEHGSMASTDQASSTMNSIQQMFNEPSDSGIQAQLSGFWAGFDDVANNPADGASRTQLLDRADTLAASFDSVSTQLGELKNNTSSELGATVADINSKSASIAQLNKAIKANSIAGLPVNDLEDQRDLLANQISEASGATLRAGDFNQVNVMLNGTALVSGDTSTGLSVDGSGPTTVLRWATDNSAAAVTSGKAGGELDAINATIPNYVAKLDAVATGLRDQVNQVHGTISGSLAVAAQDQSASGRLKFVVALDNGSFAAVTVPGANWSGAGGAAALQTALQAAVNSTVGAGNATVTVSGGNGNPLAVGLAPTGTHQLQVRANGTSTGLATLLGNTASGNYVGVSSAVERNIVPGQRIQVNVNGDSAFGSPGSDLFGTLAQISRAVLSNPSQLGTLQTTPGAQTTQVQNSLGPGRVPISSGAKHSEPKHFGWADDETEPVEHRRCGCRAGDGATASTASRLPGRTRGHGEGDPALVDRLLEVGNPCSRPTPRPT